MMHVTRDLILSERVEKLEESVWTGVWKCVENKAIQFIMHSQKNEREYRRKGVQNSGKTGTGGAVAEWVRALDWRPGAWS